MYWLAKNSGGTRWRATYHMARLGHPRGKRDLGRSHSSSLSIQRGRENSVSKRVISTSLAFPNGYLPFFLVSQGPLLSTSHRRLVATPLKPPFLTRLISVGSDLYKLFLPFARVELSFALSFREQGSEQGDDQDGVLHRGETVSTVLLWMLVLLLLLLD